MLLKTVFAGFGGQGVLMMGYVLALSAMREDRHVTYLPAYGAEVRGGTANCTVVVSSEEIASPIASSPDVVVVMNFPSLARFQSSVRSGGLIFMNSDLISESPGRDDVEIVRVPANTLAHEVGNDRALNMVMLGAVAGKTKAVSQETLKDAVAQVFAGKSERVLKDNVEALKRGAEFIGGNGQ